MKIIVATYNTNKFNEFSRILQIASIEALNLNDIKAPKCEESTISFMDNAMSKASHYSLFTELITVSDDSGLVIPALGGFPGVTSARYGSESMTQSEKNRSVIEMMKEHKGNQRRAYFICALALAQKEQILYSIEERAKGIISFEEKGSNGFGYDPIFYYLEAEKTFAELTPGEKDSFSHRGKAIHNLIAFLKKNVSQ